MRPSKSHLEKSLKNGAKMQPIDHTNYTLSFNFYLVQHLLQCIVKHLVQYIVKFLLRYVVKHLVQYIVKFLLQYVVKYLVQYIVKYLLQYVVQYLVKHIVQYMANIQCNTQRTAGLQFYQFGFNWFTTYKNNLFTLSVKSNLVKLESTCTVVSVLWQYLCNIWCNRLLQLANHSNLLSLVLLSYYSSTWFLTAKYVPTIALYSALIQTFFSRTDSSI